MQFANDDNDKLFRNAGKRYPLDTSSADWQKVSDKLHANDSFAADEPSQKRYGFIWLLLFFPAIWLCNKHTYKQTISELSLSANIEKRFVVGQAILPNQITGENGDAS